MTVANPRTVAEGRRRATVEAGSSSGDGPPAAGRAWSAAGWWRRRFRWRAEIVARGDERPRGGHATAAAARQTRYGSGRQALPRRSASAASSAPTPTKTTLTSVASCLRIRFDRQVLEDVLELARGFGRVVRPAGHGRRSSVSVASSMPRGKLPPTAATAQRRRHPTAAETAAAEPALPPAPGSRPWNWGAQVGLSDPAVRRAEADRVDPHAPIGRLLRRRRWGRAAVA
jgi:hypothetical protein